MQARSLRLLQPLTDGDAVPQPSSGPAPVGDDEALDAYSRVVTSVAARLLSQVVQLSPEALKQANQEALNLDRRAYRNIPQYRRTTPARAP